jgi:hypothetical protein
MGVEEKRPKACRTDAATGLVALSVRSPLRWPGGESSKDGREKPARGGRRTGFWFAPLWWDGVFDLEVGADLVEQR